MNIWKKKMQFFGATLSNTTHFGARLDLNRAWQSLIRTIMDFVSMKPISLVSKYPIHVDGTVWNIRARQPATINGGER